MKLKRVANSFQNRNSAIVPKPMARIEGGRTGTARAL
jgi:hypothetical protein